MIGNSYRTSNVSETAVPSLKPSTVVVHHRLSHDRHAPISLREA